MSITKKCPVCDSDELVNAVAPEGGELVCARCALSYESLLAEIKDRTRGELSGPAEVAASCEEDASGRAEGCALVSAGQGDSESCASEPPERAAAGEAWREDSGAFDAVSQAQAGEEVYAAGVNPHRIPTSGLMIGTACFIGVIVMVGWLGAAVKSETSVVAGYGPEVAAVESHEEPLAAASEALEENSAAQQESAVEEITRAADEADIANEEAETGADVSVAAAHESAARGEEGKFTVQVGSYGRASEADARASSLRAAGFDAHVASAEIPNKGTWYRVQSGRFQSREEATRYARSMQSSGVVESTFVADIRD